jgi:hypothetical protein
MMHPDYHIRSAPSMNHFHFFRFPASFSVQGGGDGGCRF